MSKGVVVVSDDGSDSVTRLAGLHMSHVVSHKALISPR
jgi:hypothetical protein